MLDVLVFVYENYCTGESCPEPAHLERKLSAVGFESDEINEAMTWLIGLDTAAHPAPLEPWLIQLAGRRFPRASGDRPATITLPKFAKTVLPRERG